MNESRHEEHATLWESFHSAYLTTSLHMGLVMSMVNYRARARLPVLVMEILAQNAIVPQVVLSVKGMGGRAPLARLLRWRALVARGHLLVVCDL